MPSIEKYLPGTKHLLMGNDAIARGAHRAGVKLWDGSVVDRYAEDKEGEK